MRRPARTLALALLVIASSSSAEADDQFVSDLLSELNRARAELALPPLVADDELAAIATERTRAMATDGWFGLRSPGGREIEHELDGRGYPFRLVTEKLVRSGAEPRPLVDEWRLRADDQRQSIFHPDVRRAGVGVATTAEGRIVEIVLVEPFAGAAAPPELDPATERAALVEKIADRRRQARIPALRPDPLVERAAEEHAAALLDALGRGQGGESVMLFADRLSEIEQSQRSGSRALVRGEDLFANRELSAASTGGILHEQVAVSIVTDAASADQAIETLLAASGSRPGFLDPAMAKLGLGIARSGGRSLWVIAVRKR